MMKDDTVPERVGPWMQTSRGGQFFPQDPRPDEMFVSDIANGLAMTCRYGGQIRVDRFYSVAEHSWLLADYALRRRPDLPLWVPLVLLFHDASEAYISDLPRAVKAMAGDRYKLHESLIQQIIYDKYGLAEVARKFQDEVKVMDCRITVNEKHALMRHQRSDWAAYQFEPLEDVRIRCWAPAKAKTKWLQMYCALCDRLNLPTEEFEI